MNRAGHYIFAVVSSVFFLLSFFSRLCKFMCKRKFLPLSFWFSSIWLTFCDHHSSVKWYLEPPHHNRFAAFCPGPPGWAGARRELLDFMVQGEINRGRHRDHPDGRHSIRTNQCPPPPSPFFYRPHALPATQPTVSKHWRQLVHLD